jgi:sensor histidine kinase YesM
MLWWSALYLLFRPYDGMGTDDLGEIYPTLLRSYGYFEAMAYFAVLGVTYSVDYRRRLQAREVRAAQLEASLATARLDALKMQLQPHFLFNTLHSIGGLVRQSRSNEAVEVIAGLSDLLRYSLDHADEQLVTLDRELAILDRYLAIQKIRFPDRLAVTVDVPDELRRTQVPAMILQPLAENAVRHGIEPSTGPGTIAVRARRAGSRIAIEIANTGPKLRDGESGIGLANTRARLGQLYGANHALVLRNEGDGVIAILEVPA